MDLGASGAGQGTRSCGLDRRWLASFEKLRGRILSIPSEIASALAGDVISMRKRMREELTRKAGRNAAKPAFDLKQGFGGIVDIEFMVQYFVLSQSDRCAPLYQYSDNVRILEAAARCEILSQQEIGQLIHAYLALRSTLHEFALQETDAAEIDDDEGQERIQGLAAIRQGVSELWQKMFAPYTESVRTSKSDLA
jgi:[glutamine synthetase] adenylyltransferase / [glutamine synthetase]-adenylyl-L-tyrosine phosphorylase